MTKTVLILGPSGKIGTHAARAFAARGWTVRSFNRKTDDIVQSALGCDVIVNGLNPPNYHNWADLIPAITKQVIAAAKASGATVIIPGNVYHFGGTPGEWSETTHPHPISRKGSIRLDMERTYKQSGVQTIVLRAGDLIDPDHNGDMMSLVILSKLSKGKLVVPGPMDRMHSYAYLPDWADAAARLADRRQELAPFEDIPFPGHSFTLSDLKQALEDQLGRPLKVSYFPWWAMRLASPVWELARELGEMRYLWQVPHSLSSRRFDVLLPDFAPTPFADVIRAALPADVHPNQPVSAGSTGKIMA